MKMVFIQIAGSMNQEFTFNACKTKVSGKQLESMTAHRSLCGRSSTKICTIAVYASDLHNYRTQHPLKRVEAAAGGN